MTYQVVQETHIGHRRRNEDRVGHWSTGGSWLLALADGTVEIPDAFAAQREEILKTLAKRFLVFQSDVRNATTTH